MNINFLPFSKDIEELVPPPVPSKITIPRWYKEKPNFSLNNVTFDDAGKIENLELKQCMPFLDSLMTGYTQLTWVDIYVKKENDKLILRTASGPDIVHVREKNNLPIDKNEYYDTEFIWQIPYSPKTPKGYSTIFTHPFNRFDLPFTTLTGIVDTDDFYHVPNGNYPFYIKNGFEGIIPAGTPMYQMIPLKRENWESNFEQFNEIEKSKRHYVFISRFVNTYKQDFWKKKKYN
jgi:hypothetical protein